MNPVSLFHFLFLFVTVNVNSVGAFTPNVPLRKSTTTNVCQKDLVLFSTRRSFTERLTISTAVIISSLLGEPIEEVKASGGATAGGVYLLSVS